MNVYREPKRKWVTVPLDPESWGMRNDYCRFYCKEDRFAEHRKAIEELNELAEVFEQYISGQLTEEEYAQKFAEEWGDCHVVIDYLLHHSNATEEDVYNVITSKIHRQHQRMQESKAAYRIEHYGRRGIQDDFNHFVSEYYSDDEESEELSHADRKPRKHRESKHRGRRKSSW